MTQEEDRSLSKTIPVLVATLICDVAVTDPTTGKRNLIGIFDKIHATKFPAQRPVFVYIKLTDAEGDYEISVRYTQRNTSSVLAEAKGRAKFLDRMASSDIYIEFPPLPIPEAGRYEFEIYANGVYLGAAFLDAIEMKL